MMLFWASTADERHRLQPELVRHEMGVLIALGVLVWAAVRLVVFAWERA